MIEIDILPASTDAKGGDSVLIRIGTFSYDNKKNNQKVILIDSGYQENADRITSYLSEHYQTDTIDIAIISHPDMDHISGFKKLLDDDVVKIKETFIHDPWSHAKTIYSKTRDGRRTINAIKNEFDESLKSLSEILDNVDNINTEPLGTGLITEFDGVKLYLLGPSKEYYQKLLYCFPGMEGEIPYGDTDIYHKNEVDYSPHMPHFLENPVTSAKNSSSTIILIHGKNDSPIALFTGDAGTEAIEEALKAADYYNLSYKNVNLFQIPHHGSIKNISEHLIKRIQPIQTYVSAPPNNPKHPSRLLLNYLDNNGFAVRHIKDISGIRYSYEGAPSRPGWTTATPFNRYRKVFRLKG